MWPWCLFQQALPNVPSNIKKNTWNIQNRKWECKKSRESCNLFFSQVFKKDEHLVVISWEPMLEVPQAFQQDVTLSIVSSHLSQGSPFTYGPPFPNSIPHKQQLLYVNILRTNVRLGSCWPETLRFFWISREETGLTTLTSHFSPHEPDFPQRTVWGLWFGLVIFPGSSQWGRPPPSNKHIYQQKI